MRRWVALLRRLAVAIAVASLLVNLLVLVVSAVLWAVATAAGWVHSVTFVSHVSMLALVFAGLSGTASGIAGLLILIPTDDLVADDTPPS